MLKNRRLLSVRCSSSQLVFWGVGKDCFPGLTFILPHQTDHQANADWEAWIENSQFQSFPTWGGVEGWTKRGKVSKRLEQNQPCPCWSCIWKFGLLLSQSGLRGSKMIQNDQYNIFLIIWGHFGPIWTLLDHFRQNLIFCLKTSWPKWTAHQLKWSSLSMYWKSHLPRCPGATKLGTKLSYP